MINLSNDRAVEVMAWDQFSRLDTDCKVAEIRRLLPLVSGLREDVETVKRDMSSLATALQEKRNNIENVVLHDREDRDLDTARTGQEEFSFPSTSSRLRAGGPHRPTELPVTAPVSSDWAHDQTVIAKSRSLHKRVKLNVGGIRSLSLYCISDQNISFHYRHEVMWKILENVPDSKLGMLAKVCVAHCNDWQNITKSIRQKPMKKLYNFVMTTP